MTFQKCIIALCIIFTTQSVLAKNVQSGAFLFDPGKAHLKTILKHRDLIVDHVSSKGYEVYGPNGLHKYLDQLGVDFIDLSEENSNKQNTLFSNYPTPEQIGERLKELASENTDILKLFSLGKSHEGRELWTVKISDNVEVDEVEPEFKYIANMHGNEIVGRELMVMLIFDLVEAYRQGDKRIRNIINNTEIYITPTMNPDGSAKKRRGNARWTDLNRDFPDFTTDPRNTPKNRQPETQAIMKFQAQRKFSMSANFHGGTECVNYPWDTSPETAPLTDFIIDLSKEYASFVPGMRNSTEFEHGITNGYAWYEVNGGMQDWSYHWYGDMQITIELSHSKWPGYHLIQKYYDDNRPALLKYMERIHQGAGFNLQKGGNGEVLITRLFDNGIEKKIGNFAFAGKEYYKVLPAGNYRFDLSLENGDKFSFATNAHPERISPNGQFFNIKGL